MRSLIHNSRYPSIMKKSRNGYDAETMERILSSPYSLILSSGLRQEIPIRDFVRGYPATKGRYINVEGMKESDTGKRRADSYI